MKGETQPIITSPGWEGLTAALHAIGPTGHVGFEGCMATLLGEILHTQFVVAASGSQPTADAMDTAGQYCIEAKCYLERTSLGLNDIVGKIYSARTTSSSLQVFVIAVTRDSAQLRQRMLQVENDTGLDILVLECHQTLSSLSALVILHWQTIRKFLDHLPSDWDVWANREANTAEVKDLYNRTVAELTKGSRTQHWLIENCRSKLLPRFATPSTTPARNFCQNIHLDSVVKRSAALEQLTVWWQSAAIENAAIEAEEGFGKTWAAASFAKKLLSDADAPPILWLESTEWSACGSIEEVLQEGLRTIIPDGDPRIPLFIRKALLLWDRPILIVLDGVNEHQCLESAQKLLNNYSRHKNIYKKHFRLLFTTRPLRENPAWVKSVWQDCKPIPLKPFDDAELSEALRIFAKETTIIDLPENIRDLAKIPRYFHLVLRLRERLRGLGQIDKPLLLFIDLLDKIQNSDPAIRGLFGTTLKGAEDKLAYLANHAKQLMPTQWTTSRPHIAECFPNLSTTLTVLAGQPLILEDSPGRIIINEHHVILGYALHLVHLAEQFPTLSVNELVEKIGCELEPNRNDDQRTEAVYLALLLTCLRPQSNARSVTNLRTALLRLWCSSNNAKFDSDRLSFWPQEDIYAYTNALQKFFHQIHSTSIETELISPLVSIWRKGSGKSDELSQIIGEWLALVHPAVREGESVEEATERAQFPIAESYHELRLSSVALSILSHRADERLVPTLARGLRSTHFCVTKFDNNGKIWWCPTKSISDVYGVVLRWTYGEKILEKISSLAQAETNEGLLSGYRDLAQLTYLIDLPPHLAAKHQEYIKFPHLTPEAKFSDFKQWISDLPKSDPNWPNRLSIGALESNPAIPNLTAQEETQLVKYFLPLKESTENSSKEYVASPVQCYEEIIPWLARSRPELLSKVNAACWYFFLMSENPNAVFSLKPIPLLPQDCQELLAAIIARTPTLLKSDRVDMFFVYFTTVLLLSAKEETWFTWFEHVLKAGTWDHPPWQISPAYSTLQNNATHTLLIELKKRYLVAIETQKATNSVSAEALYWLKLLATCRFYNTDLAAWALQQIDGLSDKDQRIESFLAIIASNGTAETFNIFLKTPSLKKYLVLPRNAQLFGNYITKPLSGELNITYQDVARQISPSMACGFLLVAANDDDRIDYAREVARVAIEYIRRPSGHSHFGFTSQFSVDDHSDVTRWGLQHQQPESHASHSGISALWGVQRSSPAIWADIISGKYISSAAAALNSEQSKHNERHDRLPDTFVIYFQGAYTIGIWAKRESAEYLAFIDRFFCELDQDRGHLIDVGGFAYALLKPLAVIDINKAYDIYTNFFTKNTVRVFTFGSLPAFIAEAKTWPVMPAPGWHRGGRLENVRRNYC